MAIPHTGAIGISWVFVEISSMEIRFATINYTRGIRQYTSTMYTSSPFSVSKNEKIGQKKKEHEARKNLVRKDYLILFYKTEKSNLIS